ncbi:MAG: hypothetical protein H6696_09700 [Deferribacteres bacterium]|nr:hypothetical protein [candidate division KSB1 bacterium]MCB9502201.1 hypothetical protein [Deferribacteres bacterium]
MKTTKVTLSLVLAIVVFFGCEKVPTDPTKVEDNQALEKATEQNVALFNTLSSISQIENVMSGPAATIEIGDVDVSDPQTAKAFSDVTKSHALAQLHNDLLKKGGYHTLSDSLIWEVTVQRPVLGYTERTRVYYDFSTGKAIVENVKFDYREQHWLELDSARVHADLAGTLEDDSDDIIESLYELKQYKAGHFIQKEISSIEIDPYTPGAEPTSARATSETFYPQGSYMSKKTEQASFDNGSGSLAKDIEYADGTKSHEQITFNPDGTGTFEEQRRFGIRISGTFDSAEQDGQGSFTKLTTFPEGGVFQSIYEAGDFSMTAQDSALHGAYEKEVKLWDGTVLKESIAIEESYINGYKKTVVSVTKNDGSFGTVTIQENDGGSHVSGIWTEADGTYILSKADYYPDGSARVEFKVYASEESYNNGDAPIVSGLFNFNPDSSGTGTASDANGTYDVTLNADGSQTITN